MKDLKKYFSFDVYQSSYVVKKYTDNYYKIIYLKSCRQSGFEPSFKIKLKNKKTLTCMNYIKTWIFYNKMTGHVLNKLRFLANKYYFRFSSNLSRARNKVYEYCICNDFEYFVTLTINQDKYNRKNLKTYYKDFSQFIRDYRKKYNIDIQYLFIPEQHKDGNWHMHGLIKGIPQEHFNINDNGYLDWYSYKNKFGFISLDKIRNSEACSIYMTKYITKDFYKNTKINKNNKLYYCSKGLRTSETVYKGNLDIKLPYPNFENNYLKIYDIYFNKREL